MKRVVLIGLAVVAFASCGSDSRTDQVVDELADNGELARYCSAIEGADKLGFSEEESYAAFREGYTRDDPPARDVFEEIRSRC